MWETQLTTKYFVAALSSGRPQIHQLENKCILIPNMNASAMTLFVVMSDNGKIRYGVGEGSALMSFHVNLKALLGTEHQGGERRKRKRNGMS